MRVEYSAQKNKQLGLIGPHCVSRLREISNENKQCQESFFANG